MADTLYAHDCFLIAMPGMDDPRFRQTVTYLCEFNEEGALGIIINQPTDTTMAEVLDNMKIPTPEPDSALVMQPVLYGGPVQQDRGFVIHAPLGDWSASLKVSDSIAVTASRDIIEAIAVGNGPEALLTCVGCAGWEAGQLDQEIADNLWLIAPADKRILFEVPYDKRWHAAGMLLGIDLDLLSTDTGHA